ncbi:hypothetical protein ACU686_09105 [Yinghuangia aomiensis]
MALRIGNMHQEKYGTLAEVTATDLGIGPGDAFEILVGGPERAPTRRCAGCRSRTVRGW